MQAEFWLQRWQAQHIGFHLPEVNPLLTQHLPALGVRPGQRVFVPLCGKTLDIHWLLAQGLQVVGVELSALAVEALFEALQLMPEVSTVGALRRYTAPGICLFQGDLFALTATDLGTVDAVYDRAALIALPDDMRQHYTQHLMQITHTAPQLLISFRYDPSVAVGPPFSVSHEEIAQHYAAHYKLHQLTSMHLPQGFKGQYAADETVWWLQPHRP